ncbi:MAG: hypothetical protein U0235_34085 [Polyangiaceae bacterium]
MRSPFTRRASAIAVLAVASLASPDAAALDKQGSAHAGVVGSDGDDDGFDVSGALTLGSAIANKTYAARPDNTGKALMRYAAHADVDLFGRRLSLPLDVNLFSDRERKGALVFAPTELDLIGGVTTTFGAGFGDLELGARVERDMPIDRGGFSQTYVDGRARYLYSLAARMPAIGRALADGDLSGHFTFGTFAVNPSCAARPGQHGSRALRYAGHTVLSVFHDLYSVGVDATLFTDRRASNVAAPSELDLTYEVILREAPWELHVAYERDMPVDQGGMVQSFIYALVVWGFDLKRTVPAPLENRATIPSP